MAPLQTPCRSCHTGLEHCHGTVIVHIGQPAECTDDNCVTPEAEHTLRIDCDTVGCDCAQPIGSPVGRCSTAASG